VLIELREFFEKKRGAGGEEKNLFPAKTMLPIMKLLVE
jgi:hypothetical protein